MRKAIAHTAAYDTAIAATLADLTVDGERFERPPAAGAAHSLTVVTHQNPRPAIRRESAPGGRVVRGGPGVRRCASRIRQRSGVCRARSSRIRTCWTSMRRRASCSSSTSRPPRSSSTPTRAARPRHVGRRRLRRGREADALAAYGGIVGINRADRRGDGRGHRFDVHRGGHRAGGRAGRARRARTTRPTCGW